jgi:hypothetical protein
MESSFVVFLQTAGIDAIAALRGGLHPLIVAL